MELFSGCVFESAKNPGISASQKNWENRLSPFKKYSVQAPYSESKFIFGFGQSQFSFEK